MNPQTTSASGANGHSSAQDIFVLTDEQILEIEPETQNVIVREDVPRGDSPVVVPSDANAPDDSGLRSANGLDSQGQASAAQHSQSTQAGAPVLLEPPAWLAETMNDPQRGAEARALWEGAQRAEKEAASYREVFAKPEEARTAAERARVLDDIDRAYFAGDATQRAQLAAMMMREDPAAFREMVFEGLRAMEAAQQLGNGRSVAPAVGATLESPTAHGNAAQPAAQANHGGQQSDDSAQQAHLVAYAAFEKAANEDLERSVGSAIERTLEHALPAAGRAEGAALKGRMAAAIRQDVEKALQGDRQLGEQVGQILSRRRLDDETRTALVRLIGARAQQLVPGATKCALKDWTQTTLAAHRGKNAQVDAASARREVAPAEPAPRVSQPQSAHRTDAARSVRMDGREPAKGRLNYGRLSDEQILDL
jgi:hypothetical protein